MLIKVSYMNLPSLYVIKTEEDYSIILWRQHERRKGTNVTWNKIDILKCSHIHRNTYMC